MIIKKLNIGNRNEYNVLIIDGISDTLYKTVALLENTRKNDPEPFIVALGYDLESGTWKNGWYYSNLKNARDAFFRHIIGG